MRVQVQIPQKPEAEQLRGSRASFGTLQRKCACGGSGALGAECEECKKKQMTLQRHPDGPAGPTAVPPIVHEVLRSPGQPLDAETRAFFEPRFGHDFSKVRVHTDAKAGQSARAVDAVAYTVGRDLVFDTGQYSPGTVEGKGLLGHELTHVVQQSRKDQCTSSVGNISRPSDVAEREAERIGRDGWNTPSAPVETSSFGRLQRLGANPGCSKREADAIHQGIFDARSWLDKAIPALEKSPLDPLTLGSLRRNFGPTYGVAANANLIHDRLAASRNGVGTIPYSCAKAPTDATCAAGHCGYTPGAGSHQATICADVTLTAGIDPVFRAGCVLHESFHATFAKMGVDYYSGWHRHSSSTAGYPGSGTDPLLNADSYTTLVMDLS